MSGRNIIQVRPSGLKHISRTQTEGLDEMILRRDWILATRAGTLGRYLSSDESEPFWIQGSEQIDEDIGRKKVNKVRNRAEAFARRLRWIARVGRKAVAPCCTA